MASNYWLSREPSGQFVRCFYRISHEHNLTRRKLHFAVEFDNEGLIDFYDETCVVWFVLPSFGVAFSVSPPMQTVPTQSFTVPVWSIHDSRFRPNESAIGTHVRSAKAENQHLLTHRFLSSHGMSRPRSS